MSKPAPIFHANKADLVSEWDGVKITNDVGFRAHLRSLKGELELIVRKRVKPVSDQQYGYYFGVIVPLLALELWGEDDRSAVEKMHMALKVMFQAVDEEVHCKDGSTKTVKTIRSMSRSKGFTKDDMMNQIDRVIHWGSTEFGIVFPEPGQVTIPEYYYKFE